MTDKLSGLGLKALSLVDPQTIIQDGEANAEDSKDLSAIHDFRKKLAEYAAAIGPAETWDRKNQISLQNIVAELVGKIMDTEIPGSGETPDITVKHVTTQIIEEHIAILKDLDYGLTDKRVRAEKYGGSAALGALDRAAVAEHLKIVSVIARHRKIKINEAQKLVAQELAKSGAKVRGKKITQSKLKNWRRYPPGSR